ncbi:methyl-accepting chemotaxis protein [Persephonella sp.]
MSIKTKLLASLIVEVLVIFFLTEYVHSRIKGYLQVEKAVELGNRYVSVLTSAKLASDYGLEIDTGRLSGDLLNSIEPDGENPYISRISTTVQQIASILQEKGKEGISEGITILRQELDSLEKTGEELLSSGLTVLVLIPVFSLIIIGLGAYTTYRSVVSPVRKMIELMKRIREGDLTVKLAHNKQDELGTLGAEFDRFVEWVRDTFVQLSDSAGEVSRNSTVLITDLTVTKEKNDRIQRKVLHLAVSSEVLSLSVDNVNRHIKNVYETVKEVENQAVEGSDVIVSSINEVKTLAGEVVALQENVKILTDQSEKIKEVVNTIKAIADQTNLLALNAAIEAARAGEAGKGFAVVADEVRMLANKTKLATEEIGSIVETISGSMKSLAENLEEKARRAEEVQKIMETSGVSIERIRESIKTITDIASEISVLVEEQEESLNVVKEEIVGVSEDVDRFNSIFRELESSVINTEKTVDGIIEMISRFELGKEALIDRGRILFMEWLISIPETVSSDTVKKLNQTEFYRWLEEEFKGFALQNNLENYYRKLHSDVLQIDSLIEEISRKKDEEEVFRKLKSLIHSFMDTLGSIKKELKVKNGRTNT